MKRLEMHNDTQAFSNTPMEEDRCGCLTLYIQPSSIRIVDYKKLKPTPKLRPFLPSSPLRMTSGSEKLTSNLAAGCA